MALTPGRRSGGPAFDPCTYRRWYDTPLGAQVDAEEKAVVLALAALERGEHVLDVGCGDGNYTGPAAALAGFAVGLDSSRSMLAAARARLANVPDTAWVAGDATRLPFRDGSFDVVLIITVLCFASHPEAALAEAFRVVRPGGRVVVGELGRWSSWALERRIRGLLGSRTWRAARFYSRAELVRLLAQAGFRHVNTDTCVFHPPSGLLVRIGAADVFERVGRRWCPWSAAFIAASGERPMTPPQRRA